MVWEFLKRGGRVLNWTFSTIGVIASLIGLNFTFIQAEEGRQLWEAIQEIRSGTARGNATSESLLKDVRSAHDKLDKLTSISDSERKELLQLLGQTSNRLIFGKSAGGSTQASIFQITSGVVPVPESTTIEVLAPNGLTVPVSVSRRSTLSHAYLIIDGEQVGGPIGTPFPLPSYASPCRVYASEAEAKVVTLRVDCQKKG